MNRVVTICSNEYATYSLEMYATYALKHMHFMTEKMMFNHYFLHIRAIFRIVTSYLWYFMIVPV